MILQPTFSRNSVLAVRLLACSLFATAALAVGQTGTTPTKPAVKATAPGAVAKKAVTGTAKPGTATKKAAPVVTLKTPAAKRSYAVGVNMGMRLKGIPIPLDTNLVTQGFKDALGSGKLLMTEAEMRQTLTDLQTELTAKQEEAKKQQGAAMKAMGDKNRAEGEAFLAANKSKDGVITLPSGLQYKILTPGTGPKPTAADTVECNYRGTLINGKEFDSSTAQGGPAKFPVGGVIKGWTEALQLMPVGSKWQLVVPGSLAYGPQGNRGIEPESTLIFEVELVSIVPKEAAKPDEKKMEKMDDKKMDDKKMEEPKKQ